MDSDLDMSIADSLFEGDDDSNLSNGSESDSNTDGWSLFSFAASSKSKRSRAESDNRRKHFFPEGGGITSNINTFTNISSREGAENKQTDANAGPLYLFSTDSGRLEEAEKCKTHRAKVTVYAYRGGNYNTVDVKENTYILDCGINKGASLADFEKEDIENLFRKNRLGSTQNVPAIVLSHGHGDHIKALRYLLFGKSKLKKCHLIFKEVECVILGGNPHIYLKENANGTLNEFSEFEKLIGSILYIYKNCKIFSSYFKTDVVTAFNLTAKINKIRALQTWNEEQIAHQLGKLFSLYFRLWALDEVVSKIPDDNISSFIPQCTFDPSTNKYIDVSGVIVDEILYLSFLNRDSIRIVFPVLNAECISSGETGPRLRSIFENGTCLMALVEITETDAEILEKMQAINGPINVPNFEPTPGLPVPNESLGTYVNLKSQCVITSFLFPADAPRHQYSFIADMKIDNVVMNHHADCHETYNPMSDCRRFNPKCCIFTMAERLWTPRRGYLEAANRTLETLVDIGEHNVYFHVYDVTNFPDGNTLQFQASDLPHLYYCQGKIHKNVLTVFDKLTFFITEHKQISIFQAAEVSLSAHLKAALTLGK